MTDRNRISSRKDNIERLIAMINGRIENLKVQFNLFFAGELRVPPENEREEIEKMVRDLMLSPHKSPKNILLIQNLSSTFSVYNNLWKKKLSEVESGLVVIKKKKTAYTEEPKPTPKKEYLLDVSLNREDSFETFFNKYSDLMDKSSANEKKKENVINSLKSKLISQNLIDARVRLSVSDGRLKLKVEE
jgi:hypothetical protein